MVKPLIEIHGLAAIGIELDPSYYPKPNITYSLIRKIALKRVPLAETITTHTEIVFIFKEEYLAEIMKLFQCI